jgi:hypothetical protein
MDLLEVREATPWFIGLSARINNTFFIIIVIFFFFVLDSGLRPH